MFCPAVPGGTSYPESETTSSSLFRRPVRRAHSLRFVMLWLERSCRSPHRALGCHPGRLHRWLGKFPLLGLSIWSPQKHNPSVLLLLLRELWQSLVSFGGFSDNLNTPFFLPFVLGVRRPHMEGTVPAISSPLTIWVKSSLKSKNK